MEFGVGLAHVGTVGFVIFRRGNQKLRELRNYFSLRIRRGVPV